MTKKEKSQSGLKALNDICIIEEFPIEAQHDTASGFTSDVVSAIKSGTLVIPDIAQYALEKFPLKGKVLSVGNRVQSIKAGDVVLFARLGGMRWQDGDKQMIAIRECDIHALFTD